MQNQGGCVGVNWSCAHVRAQPAPTSLQGPPGLFEGQSAEHHLPAHCCPAPCCCWLLTFEWWICSCKPFGGAEASLWMSEVSGVYFAPSAETALHIRAGHSAVPHCCQAPERSSVSSIAISIHSKCSGNWCWSWDSQLIFDLPSKSDRCHIHSRL